MKLIEKIEIMKARRIFGIELNLDIIILLFLWFVGWKIPFWIFLVLFIINALTVSYQIENFNKK